MAYSCITNESFQCVSVKYETCLQTFGEGPLSVYGNSAIYVFTLWVVFVMARCWIFSSVFPGFVVGFFLLQFINVANCPDDFLIWCQPCFSGMNTTCLWNINLLNIVGLLIISLYCLIVFLFLCCFHWNFKPKLYHPHKVISRMFPVFQNSLQLFLEAWNFNILQNLWSPRIFFMEQFLTTDSIPWIVMQLFWFTISLSQFYFKKKTELWQLYFSRDFSILFKCKCYWH